MLRTIKKIGGSLAVMIPRDVAEMMAIGENSSVRVTLVGRQLVLEPDDDYASDAGFQRAFAAVLRQHSRSFQAMADFDSGKKRR